MGASAQSASVVSPGIGTENRCNTEDSGRIAGEDRRKVDSAGEDRTKLDSGGEDRTKVDSAGEDRTKVDSAKRQRPLVAYDDPSDPFF